MENYTTTAQELEAILREIDECRLAEFSPVEMFASFADAQAVIPLESGVVRPQPKRPRRNSTVVTQHSYFTNGYLETQPLEQLSPHEDTRIENMVNTADRHTANKILNRGRSKKGEGKKETLFLVKLINRQVSGARFYSENIDSTL
jgi:hypothetical protein